MATTLTIIRHGETEWSRAGRHTGRTDLRLTEAGEDAAMALKDRLSQRTFALVLTSPLRRARRTAELAGLPDAEADADLAEWDYGAYEGMTTAKIREDRPGWLLWDDGVVDGEAIDDVARRADRVIARARAAEGDVLAFAHGHVLRVLASRWLGVEPGFGRHLRLDPATISVLGWERETPAIDAWNCRDLDRRTGPLW